MKTLVRPRQEHKVASREQWIKARKDRNETGAAGELVHWVKRHDRYDD